MADSRLSLRALDGGFLFLNRIATANVDPENSRLVVAFNGG
jgi:hypothetical protein